MTRSYKDESETARELRDRASISRSSHVGNRATLPAKGSTALVSCASHIQELDRLPEICGM